MTPSVKPPTRLRSKTRRTMDKGFSTYSDEQVVEEFIENVTLAIHASDVATTRQSVKFATEAFLEMMRRGVYHNYTL